MIVKYGNVQIETNGVFIYKEQSLQKSIDSLYSDYIGNKIDYNLMLGSFLIKITDLAKTDILVFSDNSGTKKWYYNQKYHFYDGFLKCIANSENLTIDYNGLAQYLSLGTILYDRTLFTAIKKTEGANTYRIIHDKLFIDRKNLIPLLQLHLYKNMEELFCVYHDCLCEQTADAIITGGVDSRTVVSHLLKTYGKENVKLFISGNSDSIDVKIAQKIAFTLETKLNVVEPQYNDKNNFLECYNATDGLTGIYGINRLKCFNKKIEEMGLKYIYGGVCGEYYKNSFINQDFPFYFGKANYDKFYDYKVLNFSFPISLCGEKLGQEIMNLKTSIINSFSGKEKKKNQLYLDLGMNCMEARMTSNGLYKNVTHISPLADRNSIALIYNKNPYSLELSSFQRKEVSRYCPDIAKITTDRGSNCSNSFFNKTIDLFKNYKYLTNVYRDKKRGNNNNAKSDFDSVSEYVESINYLIINGVINNNYQNLPESVNDRLFSFGYLLKTNNIKK